MLFRSYETLVNDIIHPTGFIMFSELDVNDALNLKYEAEEVVFTPYILGYQHTPPVIVNPVAPEEAEEGNLWFNSTNGHLYVWYVDVNSAQWVETNPDLDNPPTGLSPNPDPDSERGFPVIISSNPPEFATRGSLWFNDVVGNLYMYYVDATSAQWVDTNPHVDPNADSPYSSTTNSQQIAPVTISSSAPLAIEGDLWYNDVDGVLYVYYSDPDSDQWVDVIPDGDF